jgi:glutaredoxin 3
MQKIEIFTKANCPWCDKAMELLKETIGKGRVIIKYPLEVRPEHKTRLLELYPEAKTVPQIFIDDKHIGGYEDLVEYVDNTTSLG